MCTTTCPGGLVANEAPYECGMLFCSKMIISFILKLFSGCPELNDANGDFEYTSSVRVVGSDATLTCDSEFEVNGSSLVTCIESGWTGTPNCERTNCLHCKNNYFI